MMGKCLFIEYEFWPLIADGNSSFPVVMVGGVLEANKSWDIGTEVIKYIQTNYPAVHPIKPQVSIYSFSRLNATKPKSAFFVSFYHCTS